MKKAIQYLGILAALIVVLLIIAVAVVYIMFPPSKIMAMAEEKVEAVTGREVTIKSAGIKFSDGFGFKLNDFSMANPAGFPATDFMRLAELGVNVKLLSLLQKKIEVSYVSLESPEVNLIVKPDSTTNFTFGKPATGTTPEQPAEKQPLRLPLSISLPIRINNGVVDYVDQTANQHIRLEEITNQVVLAANKDTQLLDVLMNLAIPTGTLTAKDEPMLPANIFPLSVDTKVAVDLARQRYQVEHLHLVADKFNPTIRSTGQWQQNAFSLTQLVVAIGQTELQVSAELTNLEHPTGSYSLKLNSDLADLHQQLLVKPPIAEIAGALTAEFSGNFQPAPNGETVLADMLPDGFLRLQNVQLLVNDRMPRIDRVSGELRLADRKFSLADLGVKIGNSQVMIEASSDLSPLQKAADWENLAVTYNIVGDVDLAEIKQQAPADFPLKALSGTIHLKLQDTVTPKTDLKDYSRLIPTGSIEAKNVTAAGDSIPTLNRLDGTIRTDANGTVKVEKLVATVNDNQINATARANLPEFKQAADWEKTRVDFNVTSPRLDLNTLLPPSDPNEPIEMPLFPGLTVNGDFAVDELIFRKYNMTNVRGDMTLKDHVFSLNNMDLEIFKGQINVKMAVDSRDTSYVLETKAEGVQSNDYLSMLFPPMNDRIYSQLFFDADISGNGLNPDEIKQNLVSNGTARLTEGKIINFDFLKKASGVVSIFNFDEIDFQRGNSKYWIENGRFYFDELTINSGQADYAISGNVSFEGLLDLKVRTLLSKAESDKVSMPQKDLFVDDNGRFIIDLKITGQGMDTRVAWDKETVMNKATDKVNKEVEKKKEEIKDKLEDKGQDLLKKLWGN